MLEQSRINEFSFRRDSAVRTAELIGLRPVWVPELAGSLPQPATVGTAQRENV